MCIFFELLKLTHLSTLLTALAFATIFISILSLVAILTLLTTLTMLTDNYSCLQWWYFHCRWYLFKYRVILHYVSKGIWDCFRFALLHSVIGLENSHHSLKKSNSNLKAVGPWPLTFSHASSNLFVFTSSSDWLLVIFPLFWLAVVIPLVLVLRHSTEERSILHFQHILMIYLHTTYWWNIH